MLHCDNERIRKPGAETLNILLRKTSSERLPTWFFKFRGIEGISDIQKPLYDLNVELEEIKSTDQKATFCAALTTEKVSERLQIGCDSRADEARP